MESMATSSSVYTNYAFAWSRQEIYMLLKSRGCEPALKSQVVSYPGNVTKSLENVQKVGPYGLFFQMDKLVRRSQ